MRIRRIAPSKFISCSLPRGPAAVLDILLVHTSLRVATPRPAYEKKNLSDFENQQYVERQVCDICTPQNLFDRLDAFMFSKVTGEKKPIKVLLLRKRK